MRNNLKLNALLLGSALCMPASSLADKIKQPAQPRDELAQVAKINFVGALLSTPCSLAVDSQEQQVNLGSISSGHFRNQGDRSQQVRFTLRFQDCLMGAHSYRDGVNSTHTAEDSAWLSGEQTVAFSFTGVADDNNSGLLKLNGASGVGVRLKDARDVDIPLNQSLNNAFLTPGDNTLNFSASLESTQKYVQADYIDAIVNINVYYF
ncbi:fimbrial protein [Enterobacter asburiae]|uniref:fimbrial protein n=1 Tax=Scandinavium sp. UTDF21-P1B TaxID=3446379 RepID=UPI00346CF028